MSLQDAYRNKLEAQMEEQKARLSLLKAKAKRLAADSQIMAYEEIAEAEKKMDQLKTRLHAFAGASGSAIKEMKVGLEDAFRDLKKACAKAASSFDKKPGSD
jgi:pyrroline-5-carboxylate reductase